MADFRLKSDIAVAEKIGTIARARWDEDSHPPPQLWSVHVGRRCVPKPSWRFGSATSLLPRRECTFAELPTLDDLRFLSRKR